MKATSDSHFPRLLEPQGLRTVRELRDVAESVGLGRMSEGYHPSPADSATTKSCRRGYVLLEIMLALGIFVVAVAPLGRVINATLESFLALESESALHDAMLNETQFIMASPFELGERTSESLDGTFKIKTQIEEYEPDLSLDDPVTNVFDVTIEVEGEEGSLKNRFQIRRME